MLSEKIRQHLVQCSQLFSHAASLETNATATVRASPNFNPPQQSQVLGGPPNSGTGGLRNSGQMFMQQYQQSLPQFHPSQQQMTAAAANYQQHQVNVNNNSRDGSTSPVNISMSSQGQSEMMDSTGAAASMYFSQQGTHPSMGGQNMNYQQSRQTEMQQNHLY